MLVPYQETLISIMHGDDRYHRFFDRRIALNANLKLDCVAG